MGQKSRRKPNVGVFVEGSLRDRDRMTDSIATLWKALARRCQADVVLHVYGIDKSQIVALAPASVPSAPGATKIGTRREPLDVAIDRAWHRDGLTHIIVAFDAWPPNKVAKGRREEIGFLLDGIAASKVLSSEIKASVAGLASRYETKGCLSPRDGSLGVLEVLYMEPMFEALLVSDEATVRNALGHSSVPKDWPKFKRHTQQPDKHIIAPAVDVAHKDVLKKVSGRYLDRKTAWALWIIERADDNASMWKHEISQRLCRLLCSL